jgi:hypothetical protein
MEPYIAELGNIGWEWEANFHPHLSEVGMNNEFMAIIGSQSALDGWLPPKHY